MPFRYIEDIATADVAFEAWGETLEELCVAAADATMNVMVEVLDTIEPRVTKELCLEADTAEMLLFELLQELIFWKDAEQLLLRVIAARIRQEEGRFFLVARAAGERLDPEKHELVVDVKAVTFHRYRVEPAARGWEATVILDI